MNMSSNSTISTYQRGRYLSFQDRTIIQTLRHEGYSLRQIALRLDCSPATVKYEFDRVNKEWNIQEIVAYYERKTGELNKRISLGKCPVCGSDVIFKKDNKNAGKYDACDCSNKKCKFVVFRHYSNRSIS